jgi:hypothetical protein
MCLMCSGFDLVGNYIEQGSLKRKDFKNSGLPNYKKCNDTITASE